MKKPAILSLSLLTLSAMMAMETPVLAATRNYVPTALVSHAAPADGSASKEKTSLTSATDRSLTSRTAYGVIYNDVYSGARSDLLKKFNQTNKALYMSEGISDSFAYFNADKYLEEYADVKEGLTDQLSESEKNDQDALRQAALSHYVEYGMQEGRDCGTAFNPVIALLAYPELYKNVSDLSPDNIRKIFQDNIHAEDTSEFSIYFYTVNDTEMLSIVRNKKNADATKYTMKDVLADAGISTKNDASDTKGTVNPFVLPAKINNAAVDVTPYQLYSLTGNKAELSIPGTATTNYQLVKDKLTNKYTMMIYMCGTNLEDDDKTLSKCIAQMLQVAPKNMNIVLLLGGTDTYANTYLDKTIGKEKTGVYYLNPDKVPKNVNWKELYDKQSYDQVINKDTLVNLATFDTASIGDPSLLSGFMNLSSDLFPAKDYGLVMWNHGGGVIGTLCNPDKNYLKNNHGFDTNDLESALRSSELVKKGGKLGMLAFDACLMGSSEIAYNLHNYYNYMYASEEIEYGDFNYESMFKAMDLNLGTGKATDYSMIKIIHDNFSYKKGDTEEHVGESYSQQTGAVYDATATEKFVTALNDMGKQLNQLIRVAPDDGKDVLRTLAIARMKCETLYMDDEDIWNDSDPKYVDIGELAHYLKSDLTSLKEQAVKTGASDEYINAIQKSIDSICALQKTGCLVMSSTWYNKNMIRSYAGQQATSIEDMSVKAPMSDLWRKTQGSTASYGTSVYFPAIMSEGKMDIKKYSGFYKGTALSDYNDLLATMFSWKRSKLYTKQKDALTNEVAAREMIESLDIEDLGDKTSPQYLVLKFPKQYDKDDKPADSFGNPMYDALVTMSGNPCIYAVDIVKDAKGNPLKTYKQVCLQNNMSPEHFNLADSSMNIQIDSLFGYGIYQEGIMAKNEMELKLLADSDSDSLTKASIVSAINNTYTDSQEKQYKIVYGSLCSDTDGFDYVYHVFHQTNNNDEFEYTGSAGKYTSGEKTFYKKMENVKQISIYDYYLHNTADGTEMVCSKDHKFTEEVGNPTLYNTGKGVKPIYLKKFTIGSNGDYKTDDFSYYASIAFEGKNKEGEDETKTDFSKECIVKKAEKADEKAKAETKTADTEKADSDTKAATDENADADTKTAADEKADTNAATKENANADAQTTDIDTKAATSENANSNTDANSDADTKAATSENANSDAEANSTQASGTETTASETPVITEEAA